MSASETWQQRSVNVYNNHHPTPLSTLLFHPFSYGCNAKKTCDVILLQKNTRGGIQVCCHAPTAPRVPTSAAGTSPPPDRKNRVLPIITNVSALAASLLQGQLISKELVIQIIIVNSSSLFYINFP
jgi:hypothetical protein